MCANDNNNNNNDDTTDRFTPCACVQDNKPSHMYISLVPRPFKRMRRKWYTLHAHALGSP